MLTPMTYTWKIFMSIIYRLRQRLQISGNCVFRNCSGGKKRSPISGLQGTTLLRWILRRKYMFARKSYTSWARTLSKIHLWRGLWIMASRFFRTFRRTAHLLCFGILLSLAPSKLQPSIPYTQPSTNKPQHDHIDDSLVKNQAEDFGCRVAKM